MIELPPPIFIGAKINRFCEDVEQLIRDIPNEPNLARVANNPEWSKLKCLSFAHWQQLHQYYINVLVDEFCRRVQILTDQGNLSESVWEFVKLGFTFVAAKERAFDAEYIHHAAIQRMCAREDEEDREDELKILSEEELPVEVLREQLLHLRKKLK